MADYITTHWQEELSDPVWKERFWFQKGHLFILEEEPWLVPMLVQIMSNNEREAIHIQIPKVQETLHFHIDDLPTLIYILHIGLFASGLVDC